MKTLILIAVFAASFTLTSAASASGFAVLIGQQHMSDGQLVCFYKNYTSGDEYSKTAYGQCPAR